MNLITANLSSGATRVGLLIAAAILAIMNSLKAVCRSCTQLQLLHSVMKDAECISGYESMN